MSDEVLRPSRLIQKLAAVMLSVERVPKRGKNTFHNYDYATEADIVAVVRKELAERHVMLMPAVGAQTREPVGEKGEQLIILEMVFTFVDGETGESRSYQWRGAGSDKGDKALYKAMTGAEKYFLLKTFLIPTGDDPEIDSKEDKREVKRRESQITKREVEPTSEVDRLPFGAVHILSVTPRSVGTVSWADVKFVDAFGEEKTLPTKPDAKDAGLSLCEQLCAEGKAVMMMTSVGPRSGKTTIAKIARYHAPPDADNAALDAEISAHDRDVSFPPVL